MDCFRKVLLLLGLFIFCLLLPTTGNSQDIRKLKVKRGHPVLFVTPEMVREIKKKEDALESFHNYVKSSREKNTDDPGDISSIRAEVDQKTQKGHIDYFINDCMCYGVDAYMNDNELSKAYAKQYILSLLSRPISGNDDMPIRGKLFALGVLYDWMYDELDDSLKKDMRNEILDIVDYLDRQWHYISRANAGGHSRFGNISALVGLLPIFHDIEADNAGRYFKDLGYVVSNWTHIFNPLQNWINRGGSHSMGWAYGASYSTFYPYMVWEFATDEESWLTDWQRDKAYFNLYGLRNDYNESERAAGAYDNFPFWEDVWSSEYAPNLQGLQVLFSAGYYGDTHAQWLYNHLKKRNINGWMFKDNPWDILYNNFSPASGDPPEDLLLSRFFPHTGFVIMRDSWDFEKNTLMVFKSSSFYAAGHHHKDQNAFTIYYKGPLAIDAGTYEATGGWGSSHFWNYYTRTVAHNSMLVYDSTEKFNGYSNDGGQYFFSIDDPDYQDVIEGGKNHLTGILRYEENNNYVYTEGDATRAYRSSKLSKYTRSIVYLRNHSFGHPAIVVYDQVIATSPAYKKTYLLHSIREPEVDGRMVKIVNDDGMDPNNRGVLYQETILPLDATIHKIGGRENNQEFYVADDGHGNPHNYNEEAAYNNPSERQARELREGGEWRVEISPVVKKTENEFLHVLSVTDGGSGYGPVRTQYVSSENMDGVIVSDRDGKENTLVLFCKNNGVLNDTVLISGNLQYAHVLLTGLDTAAAYRVEQLDSGFCVVSSDSGNVKSTKQGTLYLDASSYTPVLAWVNTRIKRCDNTVFFFAHPVNDNITGWLWDFGDGEHSSVQNPVHKYDSAGSYVVSLITTAEGVQDTCLTTITLDPVIGMPEVKGGERCGSGTVTLTAKGGGGSIYRWYEEPENGNLVAVGDTFITPVLSGSKSYYVESVIPGPPVTLYGGKQDTSGSGGYYPWDDDAAIRGLLFDVHKPITLKSVKVYNEAGQAATRTIALDDKNGQEIASKQIFIPEGESRIDLDFNITPGNAYFLKAADPHKGLYRNSSGMEYPYHIGDAVTITSSDLGTGAYYFFYDWEVETSGDSASCRKEVVAVIKRVPQPDFRYDVYDTSLYVTNITSGENSYVWDFGDGTTSSEKNPVHEYAGYDTYPVKLVAENSCGSDSIVKEILITKQSVVASPLLKRNDDIIKVFPNPADDYIYIVSTEGSQKGIVYVYDITGTQVITKETEHLRSFRLDIGRLGPGIYILKIVSENSERKIYPVKFVVR